ncbi:Hpt domain-containing protein [Paenarthrobacter sp. DKR-5]|uniref:Hpt domain-containing protein n=1 Tax=Paenarthrobacter sp. DKR-5 TaxID=2835535 RepID=UPI001BDD3001|nr:Hpt domain-containing protein [Paenarthrobacter sp. DKR-5]MBT1001933.1 Hpt domain-containing protein [Paenarthrobacter sp. DKR-5]
MSSTNTPEDSPLTAAGIPLIDAAAIETLEEQLGADGFGRRYLEAYVELWDARLLRVSRAVRRRDYEQAMDAVLSLKAASAMAGATRLCELAARQEAELVRRDFTAAEAALEELGACGALTMSALTSSYLAGRAE